jgi:acyl-coenzyme A thioesterase PaaI-like protein
VASTLAIWQRMSGLPAGKWLFSRVVCWKAPYFGSIRPRFVELRPGYAEVTIKKRRAVLNHIGTVHAIAMCNAAELAAGTMTDATIPGTHRWIPKGMSVEYLAQATTDLTARAVIEPLPEFGAAAELPVRISVTDMAGQEVFRAVITMWVSPRRARERTPGG